MLFIHSRFVDDFCVHKSRQANHWQCCCFRMCTVDVAAAAAAPAAAAAAAAAVAPPSPVLAVPAICCLTNHPIALFRE